MIVCPICKEVAEKRDLVEKLPETRCLCGSLFQKGRTRTIFSVGVPRHLGPSQEVVRKRLEKLICAREWKNATPKERAILKRNVESGSYVTKDWLTLIVREEVLYRIRGEFHRDFGKWELVNPENREEAIEELTRCLMEIEVWEAMTS